MSTKAEDDDDNGQSDNDCPCSSIEAEELAEESVEFRQEDLFTQSFPIMDEIRRQGKLCDVVLKVEDTLFPVHRIVLASTIPYFNAMFLTDMVESVKTEITIHGIEAVALEQLINFAYTGVLLINQDNVQSLMVGSSFLQMTQVSDTCGNFLKKRFHPRIVIGMSQFARSLGCAPLINACDKYIDNNFETVCSAIEFLKLSSQDVIDIIKRDELQVASEETIFTAVMRWIGYSPVERAQDLPELLSKVRLPLLTPQYLADRVSTEQAIRSSHQCRDLVDEARDFHLMPDRRSLLKGGRGTPRAGTVLSGHLYAVGGLTMDGDSLSTVEYYDPNRNRWKVAPPMKTLRSRVGVTTVARKLYALGGYNGFHRLSAVEAYSSESRRWSLVASMNKKKSAVGACTNGNQIFVCGGYDGHTSLNTLEIYDVGSDQWVSGPSMNKSRSAGGAVTAIGCCWVIGGHDGLSIFDSVERHDPREPDWHKQKPMLTKRCRLGAAALGGTLVAAGGYDGTGFLQSVELFEPTMCRWRTLAPLGVRRSRVSLVASHGKLWAVGGYDGEANLNSVEAYDPVEDSWSFVTPMAAHKGGVGVGVLPT